MRLDEADPKGLIRESYAIEGITPPECRSILLDWALSLPDGRMREALGALIAHYEGPNPGHPMNAVLRAGLGSPGAPRRRGGRAGRTGAG